MTVRCGKYDLRIRKRELGEHLAAGAAGRAGSVVEVGDGDGCDANAGSELGDCRDKRGTLGADSQAVAHVLDVCAGDYGAVGEAEGRADAEVGVGRVGVKRGAASLFEQVFEEVWECGVRGLVWMGHEV